jgi:hypothetical protein
VKAREVQELPGQVEITGSKMAFDALPGGEAEAVSGESNLDCLVLNLAEKFPPALRVDDPLITEPHHQ